MIPHTHKRQQTTVKTTTKVPVPFVVARKHDVSDI